MSDGPPPLYLDYNATTPLHPRVRAAMAELLDEFSGNPSSMHGFGRRARRIVEEAREKLAAYLRVGPAELYFTSGGTESNNLAIQGLAPVDRPLWVGASEHPSLLEPARRRWRQGTPGGALPLLEDGRVRPDALTASGDLRGGLVSIQWANNETGTIQDVEAWCEAAHERGALFHTDGAQGFFRIPEPILLDGIDSATLTAHKSFGPVGVGVLYLRRGTVVEPILCGGPQEKQVRPGTENLVAIHGLGVLAEIAGSSRLWPWEELIPRKRLLRDRIERIPGARIITPDENALPNTLLATFAGLEAETLLVRLDLAGIAVSSGSACSSGAREPSHVLKAMGIPDREIRGAVRISFGPATSAPDLERAASALEWIVAELSRPRPRA